MDIKTADVIFFSPTDTTKKIVASIVQGMNIDIAQEINLNKLENRTKTDFYVNADVVIIGVPVYGERIPKLLYPFLTGISGNNRPVVLIALYGNIGVGFALEELYKIASGRNLKVVAMGSFIGEHSFSTHESPVAMGRPDSNDLSEARRFGELIINKLRASINVEGAVIELPGKMKGAIAVVITAIHDIIPQRSGNFVSKTPKINMQLCNKCGICTKDCPMSAIDRETFSIDNDQCIRCFRCVKKCPKGARKIEYTFKPVVAKVLASRSKDYRKPRYIL